MEVEKEAWDSHKVDEPDLQGGKKKEENVWRNLKDGAFQASVVHWLHVT